MDRISKKLVIVGDGSCGKTCLLYAFTTNNFSEDTTPTIFETSTANIEVDGKTVEMVMWDTAGQEEYERLRPLAYPDSNVIVLCYSVDQPSSFYNIENKWIKDLRYYCPRTPIILVATKIDLRNDPKTIDTLKRLSLQPIKTEQGALVAKNINAFSFSECSSKTRQGVREVFEAAGRASLSKITPTTESNKCCRLL